MKTSMLLELLIVTLVASSSTTTTTTTEALNVRGPLLKTQTFLSPPFFLRPGSVANKWYYDVDFPRGHVALKSFNGEVVDESGAPVPLHETYLHHWLVSPYYAAITTDDDGPSPTSTIPIPNSGPCKDSLGQYFGLGSETRQTATWVPDPYGIEVGDPARAPAGGYEERWQINVHAIDTRGAPDKLACTECRCDSYNVTVDEAGGRIAAGYVGGLHCCYDSTRCRVDDAFLDSAEPPRKLFLRYTVSWIEWSHAAVVPVRIYIFDVTDTALFDGSPNPFCKVEYRVDECSSEDRARNNCVDMKVTKEMVIQGGDLIYAVAHLHRGGLGSSLHGQDGRLLCKSMPIYGTGQEAGNEADYVVGMSTCYPAPGTVKVSDGEVLTVVSNYSSERQHTGVMGHFYILVADPQQPTNDKPALSFNFPYSWCLPAWMWSNNQM
ncbi:hypothetical protein QOZ80_8BG0667530 [Eleusine coracana subsp. coracana]|nr:hypothetical protein QOZ80_8BG0667530 [Eleusine coracana subsp. coracana]